MCHIEHILQVGTAVLVGRRPDSTEDDVHIVDDLLEACDEVQPPGFHVLADQGFQSGLIDGNDAIVQRINLVLVHVDTSHTDTHLTEAGSSD